jgi:two-component system, OmpR family, phosphate regulon sensor histidine kinase PhoR
VKYTPADGIVALRAEKKGDSLALDVIDSGYGIPAEEQEKIFQKFFRASNVVKQQTEGTGLGLYLVQCLARLLGGTISFTSETGKGTTFRLLLPLTLPDDGAKDPAR